MGELIDITIARYEIGTIINGNKKVRIVDNKLDKMKKWFKHICSKYTNDKDHVYIYLFDYEKNTNIEDYDNRSDIS